MSNNTANFVYTKLLADDLELLVNFYRDVCNLQEAYRVDDEMFGKKMTEVIFEPAHEGAGALILMKFHDGSKPSHDQAINVFFTDDIDAFVDRIEKFGGTVSERRHMVEQGIKVAFWIDPEGNMVEVAQMPK